MSPVPLASTSCKNEEGNSWSGPFDWGCRDACAPGLTRRGGLAGVFPRLYRLLANVEYGAGRGGFLMQVARTERDTACIGSQELSITSYLPLSKNLEWLEIACRLGAG
jgi:hypothetical protein